MHKSNSTESEPVELIGAQSQQVWQVPNAGKEVSAEHLDWNMSLIHLQIQLDRLRRAGKIIHDQHFFLAEATHVSQDAMIRWIQELDRAAAEHPKSITRLDHRFRPRQQRVRRATL